MGRRREIIKVKKETNEVEDRNTVETSHDTKSWFSGKKKKSTKLTTCSTDGPEKTEKDPATRIRNDSGALPC